ncbi:MAG: NAD(P)H-dependent oxidoreductase subunit E [bacterium]
MEQEKIDEIISRHITASGRLLSILEEIQKVAGYLPKQSLVYLSKQTGVPLSQLYSLATFYSFFELQPVGKHIITVCQGTACHVKGAPRLLSALEDLLDIKRGETTPDRKFSLTTDDLEFTLNTARCFGACSMAPVIRVDGKVYGYNTPEKLPQILKRYGWREK